VHEATAANWYQLASTTSEPARIDRAVVEAIAVDGFGVRGPKVAERESGASDIAAESSSEQRLMLWSG
jgi:hypothetical protein